MVSVLRGNVTVQCNSIMMLLRETAPRLPDLLSPKSFLEWNAALAALATMEMFVVFATIA